MAETRRFFLAGLGAGAGAVLGVLFRAAGGRKWGPVLLRPPGALSGTDFLAACVRCGQCVEACPAAALFLSGAGGGASLGTPTFDPEKAPCDLCRGRDELECIAACPTGALGPVADVREVRIGTAVIIEERCLAYNRVVCRSCWHACPFPNEAIRFDAMLRPVIDGKSCVGCGLCTRACPVEPAAVPIRPEGAKGPAWKAVAAGKGRAPAPAAGRGGRGPRPPAGPGGGRRRPAACRGGGGIGPP